MLDKLLRWHDVAGAVRCVSDPVLGQVEHVHGNWRCGHAAMVTGATLWLVLIGVDASRITRRFLTGTENYSLQVLRNLLDQDQRNDYRVYLNRPLPAGLLPTRDRVTQRVIRLPRLWTQLGLSNEMLRQPP